MRKKYLSLVLILAVVFLNFAPSIPKNIVKAATVITRVDITVQAPVVGDKINKIMESYQGIPYDRPDKDAVATVAANAGYLVEGSNWILYNPNYGDDGYFYGTFQANTDYYASTLIVPKDGYTFSENCKYYVNGQQAVFAGGAGHGIAVCGKVRSVSKYNVTINFNGGTNKSLSISSPVVQGTKITLPAVTNSNVTPPNGKTFDAYEINGTRYNAGSTYTVNANTTIKLLWKNATQSYTYDIKMTNLNSVPTYNKALPKYTTTTTDTKISEIVSKGTRWTKYNASNSSWDAFTGSKATEGRYRYEVELKVKKIDANSNVTVRATKDDGSKVQLPIIKVDSTSNSTYTYIYAYCNVTNVVNTANTKKGDINRDGKINADDAADAIEIFKTNQQTSANISTGDMDGNGKVDAEDAALIIEYFKTHN